MKPAPLPRLLPAVLRGAIYRLGPRQVTAATKSKAKPQHALQELLDAVQELAHGPFQGEAEARQAASELALELEQLGAEAMRLLRQPLFHEEDPRPWKQPGRQLDTKV
jgi:hypothetical protein